MQPYSHPLVGALVGTLLFPENAPAQCLCAVGAMIPDTVLVPQFVIDKLQGKKPLGDWTNKLALATEISHSLLLWIVGALLAKVFNPGTALTALLWGGMSHSLIDSFSHANEKHLRDNDETGFLWPLPWKLGRLLGFWDYRYAPADLRPKPAEIAVDLAIVLLLVWRTY